MLNNKSYFKIVLTFIQVLYTCILCFAQNGQNEIQAFSTKVIPPSPDAASLGKYGNTPVGLHTGIPQIDIPIYTIKSKLLEVPISISYHASGIKVDEMASWVGLGWSLNAGGVITRSVVGLPDEGGFWTQSVKNNSQINSTNDINYVRQLANGQIDGESDYYFYNFQGRSGKFVYKQNDPVNPYLIPVSPIKIKYNSQGWFEAKDEYGVFYKFAAVEYLSAGTAGANNPDFKSSFYLTEISSADGTDKIQFNYYVDKYYSENTTFFNETLGPKCLSAQETPNPSNPRIKDHTKTATNYNRNFQPLRIREILFSNGKVEFLRDESRLDASTSKLTRLNEIKIYSKKADGSYHSIKSFVLGEGYFISGSGVVDTDYRLKLTNLLEKDEQENIIKKHEFAYNEVTKLPRRIGLSQDGSLAQDWWGFYNGQINNTSLIPYDGAFNYQMQVYQVGGGSRQPDETAMKACILKSISYPTGGYTEFYFEPHYYAGTTKTSRGQSASSGALGNTTDLLQQTVTFTPTHTGWAKVATSCSDVKDNEPFFSRVMVRKQNDTHYLLEHIYAPYFYPNYQTTPRLDENFYVFLNAGMTYELTVMSKGNSNSTSLSGAAFSMATITWDEYVNGTSLMAGGLRIKEVRDYESANASPLIKHYRYGVNESGYGTLLIPSDGLSTAQQEIDTEYWTNYIWGATGTITYVSPARNTCSVKRLVLSGKAVHELSTLNGAPVVYSEVSVYENSITAPNGKQVFHFDVQEDSFYGGAPKAYNNGRLQVNESWRGGDQIWNGIYVGNNSQPIKEILNNYAIYSSRETTGTKVGWQINLEGDGYPPSMILSTYFYYFDYPIYSGVKKITNSEDIQYSSTVDRRAIKNKVEYKYDNLGDQHQQLSRQVSTNSQGDVLETKYWYPASYSNSLPEIASLLNNNILATPIKTEQHLNQKIISGSISRLNADGKPYEIYSYEGSAPQAPPTHEENVIIPSGYVKKMDVTYDVTTKNINQVQSSNSIPAAYLWAYNNSYPVAKAVNAKAIEIAYSSFETDGKGGWNYSGSITLDNTSKTGKYYYKIGGGSITKSLTATGKYKLEYWAKGTINASGGTITPISTSTADANGWIFYEKLIEITTPNTTITLATIAGEVSTAAIDELRLYPSTAQMSTFTYDPLLGITSQTDPAGLTTYYEYDSAGRLKLLRDQDQKIVKSYFYHYKQ